MGVEGMQCACICIACLTNKYAKSFATAVQEFACVAEATLAEKALSLSKDLDTGLAGILNLFEKHWPAGLGTEEEVKHTLGSLSLAALRVRFKRLVKKYKYWANAVQSLRSKAVLLIGKSQVHEPPAGMLLWAYFSPNKQTVANKASGASMRSRLGSSLSQLHSLQVIVDGLESTELDSPASTPDCAPSSACSTTSDSTSTTPQSTTSTTMSQVNIPPGLVRGGMGGRGRGGAIPRATKLVVRDLVAESHVPIRDVPKVLTEVYVLMYQRAPHADMLLTHSHIREWIVEQSACDQAARINSFWACRRAHGDRVRLHVHHDGTRRVDRTLGDRQAELMAFIASYFDPGAGHAVQFVLSLRFLIGGSAAIVAQALAVCLADIGLYKILACPAEASTPFAVITKMGDVVATLGSDNADAALKVLEAFELCTGDRVSGGEWPCPTHMNALFGKNPVLALCGDAGQNYDDPVATNIQDKWWWLTSRHWAFVSHWHGVIALDGSKLSKPRRGLTGKWETMGPAFAHIVANASAIRRFVCHIEHFTVGVDGIGQLRRDAELLKAWMCDERLWAHFLFAAEWFDVIVEPVYFRLKSSSKITPRAGPHFGREAVPRLALEASLRASHLPTLDETPEEREAKVSRMFPLACAHLNAPPPAQGAIGFIISKETKEGLIKE